MVINNLNSKTRMVFLVCSLLTSMLVSLPAQAAVDRVSSIEASGEGSIYDLKATADGTLKVCTKPGRSGDRWRATIAQVNTNGAVSAVGSGSMAFTGCISQLVTSGVQYLVLVTWDRPLPGTFPSTVTTRFTSSTDTTNPPVVQLNGGALASIVPRPRSFVAGGYGCPVDGSTILPGMLLTNCQFSPAGDTDTFKFAVSAIGAASIKICGPSNSNVCLRYPSGGAYCSSGGTVRSYLSGSGIYTIETSTSSSQVGPYSLSLNGVSQEFQNGVPIAFGQTKTGTLDACADEDTFQFVCQANQTVSITLNGPSNIGYRLFSPTGGSITTGKCGTGTHTILVSNDSGLTGAYSLTLTKLSVP